MTTIPPCPIPPPPAPSGFRSSAALEADRESLAVAAAKAREIARANGIDMDKRIAAIKAGLPQ